MASLFIAEALGDPLCIGEQISLLVFMIIASKGAAGVTGAGLATLAGGLASHRPDLVDGVGLIVGIDRFMSEARALTNFAGNAVATVLIGHWTDSLDKERMQRVLAGEDPFDEPTMLDERAADERPRPSATPRPRRSPCRRRAGRRRPPRLTPAGSSTNPHDRRTLPMGQAPSGTVALLDRCQRTAQASTSAEHAVVAQRGARVSLANSTAMIVSTEATAT